MVGAGGSPQFGERYEPGPGDHCYRHPNRTSFTLCQRCGRTICGDCQVNSSVGVLCKDCVRQTQPGAAKQIRRSSNATFRRLSDTDTPIVTYAIMVICALVFVTQYLSGAFGDDGVTRSLWYAPLYSLPQAFEPWRMLTSTFAHSTGFIFHIVFNMYTLWLFGRNLEQMMGKISYLLLYLFSGLGGSLFVMYWVYVSGQPVIDLQTPTVGASGAIFGVMMATLVAYRAARVNITSLAVLLAINIGIGFLPGSNVSWQAHLGGMAFGALTTWVLLQTRGPRLQRKRTLGLVGVGALIILLAFGYFFALPITLG